MVGRGREQATVASREGIEIGGEGREGATPATLLFFKCCRCHVDFSPTPFSQKLTSWTPIILISSLLPSTSTDLNHACDRVLAELKQLGFHRRPHRSACSQNQE